MLILISLVMMGVSMLVSNRLKSKFAHYSQFGLANGMSGAQIAQKMLNDNGIYDVKVIHVPGQLTDHYNPADKTVNLSDDVFGGRSAAAAAVAAHECGHAVQHARAYAALKMRSALVPAVNICSTVMNYANMILLGFGGFMFANSGSMPSAILLVLVAANLGLVAFALITLPVEYDASNRALAWMKSSGVVTGGEYDMAEDSLKWAARTYVVAALGALANLFYFLMMFLNRRDD